jgi:hypothetical protein
MGELGWRTGWNGFSLNGEGPNHTESSVLDFEAHYAMRRMVQFGELTYREIRQRADEGCLALVPTGCTEQQGPTYPCRSTPGWSRQLLCGRGRGYPRIWHLRTRIADAAVRSDL